MEASWGCLDLSWGSLEALSVLLRLSGLSWGSYTHGSVLNMKNQYFLKVSCLVSLGPLGLYGPIGSLALGPGPWAPDNNVGARSICMVAFKYEKPILFEGFTWGPWVPRGQLGPWPWALGPGPLIITLERDQYAWILRR